jgi:hypothetical protein
MNQDTIRAYDDLPDDDQKVVGEYLQALAQAKVAEDTLARAQGGLENAKSLAESAQTRLREASDALHTSMTNARTASAARASAG